MWWMPPIVVKAGSAFHQRWLWTLYNSNAKGKMAGGKLRPYGSPNVGQKLFRCAEHTSPCHSHLLGKGRYLSYSRIPLRFLFEIAACCTFSVRNLPPLGIGLELRPITLRLTIW
jgi:hypothetical protein